VLLVAIVGLRVEVLKLGSSVGRDIQAASALQSTNQTLRSRVSELSGNQRIEDLATNMGMVMPGPMDIHFVQASTAKRVASAIRAIQEPASATFLSGLATERAADGTDAVAAAGTSAIGAQSTDDPGTVIDTPSTGSTSTDAPTTDSATGSTTGSTETSTGGTTATSDTGGTTAASDTIDTSGTTATSDTSGTTGISDTSGTTVTGDTSGAQSSTGDVASTGDAPSGSTPLSTTGGSSLAG
jgi:hypothetical protein